MIELKGNHEEIAAAVKAIAPDWPTDLIKSLDPGEWHFILNGVDTAVWIDPEKATGARCKCGGLMSEIRYYDGRPYRHCYSCHADFYLEDREYYLEEK